jgi:hypothetical protein
MDDMASETTSLLRGNEDDDPTLESCSAQSKSTFAHQVLHHWQRWKVLYLGILLIVSVDTSGSVGIAPGMRLLEDLVCRQFQQNHGRNDMSEELCGLPEVQERLAKVRGVLNMLEALPGETMHPSASLPEMLTTHPGMVLAVPYGVLADTRGRRFVLALGIIGGMMAYSWALLVFSSPHSMPLWTIYLYPLFLCIGGGAFVIGAVLLAMIAGVIPSDQR